MLLPGIAEGQNAEATASSHEKGSTFGTHPGLREAELFHMDLRDGALVEIIMTICGGRVVCIPLPQGYLF